MEKNVGNLDAYVRIWGGLLLLGIGINRESYGLMAVGAGKVAEGVTRFCPMLHMLGISTVEEEDIDEPYPVREERREYTPQAQYNMQMQNEY